MNYSDPYLAPMVSYERETRALADIRALATFSTEWEERLQVLRVYILICLESMVSAEDAFATKLSHYQKEYKLTLELAKSALAATSNTKNPFAFILLERC